MGYIIIPHSLSSLKGLSVTLKYVLAQLVALMGKEGYCFATDDYLCGLLGVQTRRAVQKYLSALEEGGFIYRKSTKNGLRTVQRRIYATDKTNTIFFGMDKNENSHDDEQIGFNKSNICSADAEQKFTHNNKYNNINNNIFNSQSGENKEELFERIYTSLVNHISNKDEIYPFLEKHPEDIHKRVKEKYMCCKDKIMNNGAYIKALIRNTVKEEFMISLPKYEYQSVKYDYEALEQKMWDSL